MYLANVRRDIFFAVSTLSQYLVESEEVPMCGSEAWYNLIWFISGDELRL
jgi:hypothetical protein